MRELSKNRKIAVAVIITFIVLTVAFIWHNSLETQSQSSDDSEEVFSVIKVVLDSVFGEDVLPVTHIIIRKLAHFSEFAVLGGEFCLLVIAMNKESVKWYLQILPCGLFVAAVDEGLQFLSDRAPAITDVMIDFFGYCTAVAVFLVIFLIRNKLKNRENQKTEEQ